MLVLTESDVASVVNMNEAIAAVREAYAATSAGDVQVPRRHHLSIPSQEADTLIMSGYMASAGGLGVKVISLFPGNRARGLPATLGALLLIDPQTGLPTVLMSATYLTSIRTGAGSGVATDLLSDPKASTVAILGAGGMAWHQLQAVIAVRPIRHAFVTAFHPANAERRVQKFKRRLAELGSTVSVEAVDSTREALNQADVVCAATSSRTPVVCWKWLKRGAHVNLTGSHTPQMQEADAETLARAALVCVDSRSAAIVPGDLDVPIRQGILSVNDLVECGELILGRRDFQRHSGDVTVFKSVGLAAQDLAVASVVLNRAIENGTGQDIDLWD